VEPICGGRKLALVRVTVLLADPESQIIVPNCDVQWEQQQGCTPIEYNGLTRHDARYFQ
jgi:hypothetical protein